MRKLVALFACVAMSSACFPQHQCESTPPFVDYCNAGEPDCQGHIIDATHWESTPMVGNWLVYGPEQQYLFHFRDAVTGAVLVGKVSDVTVSISSVENPMVSGSAVESAGNLSEYQVNTDDNASVFVRNDTCASYFVRVYVTMEPSAADAGTE